ncbi:MAG: helix-turn-helix domain-containing protein [Flavobacteriaceae bacterium]|nr:helix-turn-helix domain-containing protein [Flavobacteriaceae bacterium]
MEKVFIEKVKQIILNHLEDEKFGIDNLASEIGFSKSQIWRKIKTLTGKTTNEFIREIRLKEAAKLIQKGDYTASEIAYRVGFNSPSYFNKCFHDHFGITPGDYKGETLLGKIIQEPAKQKHSKLFKVSIFSTLIIAIVVISYLMIDKPKHSSIAVLPFLDLSEHKDQDYLSDGITEQITLELSKINALRVISRTSAMSFKDKNILSSVIAKELNVDYLLEGSVLYSSDSIRVIVQLIEPFPEEKHIWQNSYNQKFENILDLVRGISSEIALEINTLITPEEIEQVEYIVNPKAYELYLKGLHSWNQEEPEAYELYLRGRHLWNQKNTESVKKSVEYLEESINIDPTYAPAYVTLAEDYILLNKFIRNNEEKLIQRKKCREAIDKALELDDNLAEAYITKGNMIGKFDWDWDKMKKMVDKGLKLDPNNSYGHILLSKYYLIKNNFNKAIEEALLAEKLDPINPRNGCFVAENYFLANDYKRSIEQYKKVFELFPNDAFAWEGIGHVQYFSGQKEEAQASWKKFHTIMRNDYMASVYANSTFDDSINYWLEGATKGEELYCSNPPVIAQAHMFVNKEQEALKYLEIAYKYRNEDLPKYLLHPHFYSLHNDSRFKNIVNKTGVTLPYVQQEYEIKD